MPKISVRNFSTLLPGPHKTLTTHFILDAFEILCNNLIFIVYKTHFIDNKLLFSVRGRVVNYYFSIHVASCLHLLSWTETHQWRIWAMLTTSYLYLPMIHLVTCITMILCNVCMEKTDSLLFWTLFCCHSDTLTIQLLLCFQVISALKKVDNIMGMMMDGLKQRGLHNCVNIIIVSDHGEITTHNQSPQLWLQI